MGLVSINTRRAVHSGVPGSLLYLLFPEKKNKTERKEKRKNLEGSPHLDELQRRDKEVGGDFFLSYIKVEEQACAQADDVSQSVFV